MDGAGVGPLIQRALNESDGLGRRIRQTTSSYDTDTGQGVVTEDLKFVSDPLLFGRHIAELNATNDALVRSYVWGLDLSGTMDGAGGVGGLLIASFHLPSLSSCFAAYDGNGNVVALVHAPSSMPLAYYDYGPFGEPLRLTGPVAQENPFRFSTKRTDNTIDLVLYEYRAYSPILGRWLSRDPIEEPGFTLLTMASLVETEASPDVYCFADNDSIDHFDAQGLAVETAWDFVNVGVGVVSLWCNVKSGNIVGALVDGAGLALDVTATAVPFVPAGAGVAIKTYRLSKSSKTLVKNMLSAARAVRGKGREAMVKVLRYTVTEADHGHHLIPTVGPSDRWVGGELRRAMDGLRLRARQIGLDLDAAENGVALPKTWHLRETTAAQYYMRVLRRFEPLPNDRSAWVKELDELARELMKESGKLK